MAFPISPSNGQTTIINGVTYIYDLTYRSWTRQSQSLTSLSVSGNITTSSGNFIGNGALLSGLPASYGNTNVAAYLPAYSGNLGGTLTTAAQPNITSLGALGSLTVTGNVTVANLNISGNIVDTGALSLITGASGNVTLAPGGSSVVIATTTGANIAGTLNATGNITGNFILGNGSQLTGISAGASNARAVGFSLVFGG